jgi:hypothetical protein
LGQDSASYGYGALYSWGVEVVNRSTTLDALNVTVSVSVYAHGMGELGGGDYTIAVIPAGQKFVVGDRGGSLGSSSRESSRR